MKKICMPFYLDNNSSNLPFYLMKDEKGNDVIYIDNNNMIYTNTKNNNLEKQLTLFTECFNKGICSIYNINDEATLVKQIIDNNINWYINNNDYYIKLYQDNLENMEGLNVHFNSKYLCVTSYEYGDAIPEVVAGYDLTNNKQLDCEDYNTNNNLYKQLVEIRRVRIDVLISIIKKKILINDDIRLYRFLSLVMNEEINKKNYKYYLDKARDYILSKYSNLTNIDIKDIDDKNKEYGINYFYFNRIDEDINDLKYLSNKVKTKQ